MNKYIYNHNEYKFLQCDYCSFLWLPLKPVRNISLKLDIGTWKNVKHGIKKILVSHLNYTSGGNNGTAVHQADIMNC